MLPTRKSLVKSLCSAKSPRRLPKGLRELAEIDREEMSVKMMQTLERFMRRYPAVWSEAAVQYLLVEIADTQYVRLEPMEAEERLQTVIKDVLVPMAQLMDEEQELVEREKEKIHDATRALQRVQQECQHALDDLAKEHDRTSRDLEQLGQALEDHCVFAEAARRTLMEREAHIHLLLLHQHDLIVRLVRGGPAEFLHWADEEIRARGFVQLHRELQQAGWWTTIELPPSPGNHHHHHQLQTLCAEAPKTCNEEEDVRNTTTKAAAMASLMEPAYVKTLFVQDPTSTAAGGKEPEREETAECRCGNNQLLLGYKDGEAKKGTSSLLGAAVSETVQQVGESWSRVKGPCSWPAAVAGFWVGLAGRMTCLAVVKVFPQLVVRKVEAAQGVT